MRRPASDLRSLNRRLEHLAARNPEWRPWLALLGEAARCLKRPASARLEPVAGQAASREAPLLHGRRLRLSHSALGRLVTRLRDAASSAAPPGSTAARLSDWRWDRDELVSLMAATLRSDPAPVARAAEACGLEPFALHPVLERAAWVLLVPLARALAPEVPTPWPHPYCPVCGQWPLLTQLRGMERGRWAACGRCGTDWPVAWLRCLYCGQSDHRQLGALAPEGQLDSRKADTCERCGQYLKCLATLEPLDPVSLWLADLETVELDLAAREHGLGRPPQPGWPLVIELVPQR